MAWQALFGYDADTIEISKTMGELSLLPKVRDAEDDALIIANGTSCRHQITEGTGRKVLHVAQVMEAAIAAWRGAQMTQMPDIGKRDGAGPDFGLARPALAVQLSDMLREMILEGALPSGEKIREKDLTSRFGVSRTPLREAMKVLAAEGFDRAYSKSWGHCQPSFS